MLMKIIFLNFSVSNLKQIFINKSFSLQPKFVSRRTFSHRNFNNCHESFSSTAFPKQFPDHLFAFTQNNQHICDIYPRPFRIYTSISTRCVQFTRNVSVFVWDDTQCALRQICGSKYLAVEM
jgi:hypothetical protein